VKYALRRFNKSPGFTATDVVTLALGIGATAAIFTLIQQVMLRSLAVAKPEQLWRIGDAATCCYSTGYTQSNHAAENDWTLFSWEAYQRFRGDTAAFEQLAAFQVGTGNGYVAVRRAGSREAVQSRLGEFVSGNFFRTFGISAWRGRLFTDADDEPGAPPVAVISFHTWQEKYGSDPSIVGAPYEINDHAFFDHRRSATGIFRGEGRRLGHARHVAAADERTTHRRRDVSPRESRPGMAGSDRQGASGDEPANGGGAAAGRAAPVAGEPPRRHEPA
jgi:hypothetical protein